MQNVCTLLLTTTILFTSACSTKDSSLGGGDASGALSAGTSGNTSNGTGDTGGMACTADYRHAFKIIFNSKYKKYLQNMSIVAYSDDGEFKTSFVPSLDDEFVYQENESIPAVARTFFIEVSHPDFKTKFFEDLEVKQDECDKHITIEVKVDFSKGNGIGSAAKGYQSSVSDDFIIEPLSEDAAP